MLEHDIAILEFDPDKNAYITADKMQKRLDVTEGIVCCFFADAIRTILDKYPHRVVGRIAAEGISFPVYELDYNGKKVSIVQSIPGAVWAVNHIEELSAMGFTKFFACGGCGALKSEFTIGHLIIPTSAVRDEGASFHYAAPSREISMSERSVKIIEDALTEKNIPFVKGKVWTTDGFYRETPTRVARRKAEDCIAVEMENSAFVAAAAFKGVEFGQILYAGDSLGGEEWDGREWTSREDIRESVLRLALDVCLML